MDPYIIVQRNGTYYVKVLHYNPESWSSSMWNYMYVGLAYPTNEIAEAKEFPTRQDAVVWLKKTTLMQTEDQ